MAKGRLWILLIIKTETDYQKALKRLEVIFDTKSNSKKSDELEILEMLIDNYENENFPVDLPNPIEAIKFRMEQLNYTQTDLANILGMKSRASDTLNKKKKLLLDMIRKLHSKLHIPTEVLIQAY